MVAYTSTESTQLMVATTCYNTYFSLPLNIHCLIIILIMFPWKFASWHPLSADRPKDHTVGICWFYAFYAMISWISLWLQAAIVRWGSSKRFPATPSQGLGRLAPSPESCFYMIIYDPYLIIYVFLESKIHIWLILGSQWRGTVHEP